MNSEDKSLMPRPNSEMVRGYESSNPLVRRGMADLLQGTHLVEPATTSLKLRINIPGELTARFLDDRKWFWETPGTVDVCLNHLAELLVDGLMSAAQRRERLDTLIRLNAPEAIIENEQRMLRRAANAEADAMRPEAWRFCFKAKPESWQCTDPDGGAAELLRLQQLEELNLCNCRITNRSLDKLYSLQRLRKLSLNSCVEITDDGLRGLRSLTRLQSIELAGCPVTDATINALASQTGLELLNLAGCSITDKGLEALLGLTELRDLRISRFNVYTCPAEWSPAARDDPRHKGGNAEISDDGLAIVSELTQLQCLEVVGCAITDKGLAHISPLQSLRELTLNACMITDDGLKHLAPLRQLERLYLSQNKINDDGLRNLQSLVNLRELSLGDGGHITDAGLGYLTSLAQLEWLFLEKCDVTEAGVAALRLALPSCEITA